MSIYNMKGITVRFRQTPDQKRCPECGEEMKEVERCNESGFFFVWYKCRKDNCVGQWLQKIPQKFHNNPVPDISQ